MKTHPPRVSALLALLAACASPVARNRADDASAAADLPQRDGGEKDRDALAADCTDAPDATDVLPDVADASDAADVAPPDVPPPCPTGTRCGEICVDLATTVAHCGACGRACESAPGAIATCALGACGRRCDEGLADCDGDALNGCETPLTDDPLHCGACDTRCTVAHGTPRCAAGRCDVAACDPDYALVTGTCRAIPVPRPLSPLSGLAATARQPTLRWLDGPGAEGALVEVCRDRAMTVGCVERSARDAAFRPAAPLDPGAYFWRVRGVVGSTGGATRSPTWMFYVGRGDARRPTADTAAHSFIDFDADGFADAAFGRPGLDPLPGGITVFRGGSAAWSMSAPAGRDVAPPSGADQNFGGTLVAGDFDGDGFTDLVVGSYQGGTRAYLYRGGASGLPGVAAPVAILRPLSDTGNFGFSLSSVDVDGDGLQDLLVGSQAVSGAVYVYRGSPGGLATTPTAPLTPPSDPAFDTANVGAVGDMDGDGYGDAVILSTPRSTSPPARSVVWLHRGSPTGLTVMGEAVTVPEVSVINFVAGADVDGDALADVVIGSRGDRGVVVVLGGHRRSTPAPAPVIIRGPTVPAGFGASLVADFNGDGFSDVIGDRTRADGVQVYDVFTGGPAGLATTPTGSVEVRLGGPRYAALGVTRDLDGDGFEEFTLGTGFTATPGTIQLFPGSAAGLAPMPRWTLMGTVSGGAFGLGMLGAY